MRRTGIFREGSFGTRPVLDVEVFVRRHRRHRRDVQLCGDGPPGQAFVIPEPYNFIPAKDALRTANVLSGSLGRTDAAQSSFTKKLPLELRNATQDAGEKPTRGIRCVRVQPLRNGDEPDAVVFQGGELLGEMQNTAPEPVQLEYGHAIELLERRRLHQRIKRRSAGLRSRESAVDVFGGDGPAPACHVFTKLLELRITGLIRRGAACVNRRGEWGGFHNHEVLYGTKFRYVLSIENDFVRQGYPQHQCGPLERSLTLCALSRAIVDEAMTMPVPDGTTPATAELHGDDQDAAGTDGVRRDQSEKCGGRRCTAARSTVKSSVDFDWR